MSVDLSVLESVWQKCSLHELERAYEQIDKAEFSETEAALRKFIAERKAALDRGDQSATDLETEFGEVLFEGEPIIPTKENSLIRFLTGVSILFAAVFGPVLLGLDTKEFLVSEISLYLCVIFLGLGLATSGIAGRWEVDNVPQRFRNAELGLIREILFMISSFFVSVLNWISVWGLLLAVVALILGTVIEVVLFVT